MRVSIVYNHDFEHLEGAARLSQAEVLEVARGFARVLQANGDHADCFGVGAELCALPRAFLDFGPDVVVNLCESWAGDPRGELIVPALLEVARLPYTGSRPLALALSLHKHQAKQVLRAHGVPTPEWALVSRLEQLGSVDVPLPAIVKPAHEDASIGIDRRSLVRTREELAWAVERVLTERRQPALVERFIDGRELNVALLGDPPEVLPINEIDFSALEAGHPRIVTYAAKWDESAPEYHSTMPVRAALPPAQLARVQEVARAAFAALELRDYGRVDLRLDAAGEPFVIEVNPNCDLAPDAGFAKAARAAGLEWDALVLRVVGLARARG